MRERLTAHELDLRIRQRGRSHGFGNERKQLAEVVSETLSAEDRRMSARVETRDRAQRIESVGPGRGIALLRAAEHRLRGEKRDARPSRGLEPLPSLDREEHRGRSQICDRNDRQAQTVRKHAAVDAIHDASPSGTKWPTLRERSTNRPAAASRISSRVTAASLAYQSLIESAAPVERSWPQRYARHVMVSVLNAVAARSCRRTRANSSSARRSCDSFASSSRRTRSTSACSMPGRSVASAKNRYGSFISWNDASTSAASPVSTSARCSREERPEAPSLPVDVPASATVSAEIAAARGSVARGARKASITIGSVPPARWTVTRRSPCCSGSGAFGGSPRSFDGSSGPNASAACSMRRSGSSSPVTTTYALFGA